jgi:hypothetical protein
MQQDATGRQYSWQAMQLFSQMSLFAVIALCCGTIAAIAANMLSLSMIGKINELASANEKISYLWWGGEVRSRFKKAYPNHRILFLQNICIAVMILSFIALVKFWVFS